MNLKKFAAFSMAATLCITLFSGCSKDGAGSGGSASVEYTAVSTQADALMELKAGTADVAVIDYTMAKTMVGEGTDYEELTIVDGIELAVEEYGIAFRNGSNLVSAVNEAYEELLEDGTLAAIAEKYDLTYSLITDPVPSEESGTSDEDDLAYVKEKGTLIIGITEYAPMNYYDESGKLVGFDTEFAEAVCEKLGVTPEFVVIDWNTKVVELASKNIDCIWNGMTILDDLKENLDFSAAYMRNKQVLVVKDGFDISIVAEAGSAGENSVKDLMAE